VAEQGNFEPKYYLRHM